MKPALVPGSAAVIGAAGDLEDDGTHEYASSSNIRIKQLLYVNSVAWLVIQHIISFPHT